MKQSLWDMSRVVKVGEFVIYEDVTNFPEMWSSMEMSQVILEHPPSPTNTPQPMPQSEDDVPIILSDHPSNLQPRPKPTHKTEYTEYQSRPRRTCELTECRKEWQEGIRKCDEWLKELRRCRSEADNHTSVSQPAQALLSCMAMVDNFISSKPTAEQIIEAEVLPTQWQHGTD
ncbi:hypothetical protein PM082_022105 [Marasmius tenuissimus]|nr:hypothetical protein PM082_022105 [Marasmius tenuissimus]